MTKPKQHPHFPKPQQGHLCLLLGQLGQERQSLQGHLPEVLTVALDRADTPEGPSTRRTQRKRTPRLDSRQDQITPPPQGRVPAPTPGCVEMGRSSPAFCTLSLGPGGQAQAPALASAGGRAGSGSLTFPTRARSLVKVPSYKESSSERRIPGP